MKTGLKISGRDQAAIAIAIRYAGCNRLALGATHRCFEGDDFICRVVDFEACFSIEERPEGWARHIAIRDAGQGNIPQPPVVDDLLRAFGFVLGVAENLSWLSGSIVHVVEKIA